MNPSAHPFFRQFDRRDSCVIEAKFSKDGLLVVVEAFPTPEPKSIDIQIFFPSHRGFFLLDEGDMPLWPRSECFRTDHLLYQVTEGGWLSASSSENYFLPIASTQCSEWLILTANECVSVFSGAEPLVSEQSP